MIRQQFYSNTQILLVVFDVNNKSTFDHIQLWFDEFNSTNRDANLTDSSMIVTLCGNQCNDDSNIKRQVSESEVQSFAKKMNWLYFECSAKSGQNVDKMFEESVKCYLQNLNKTKIKCMSA